MPEDRQHARDHETIVRRKSVPVQFSISLPYVIPGDVSACLLTCLSAAASQQRGLCCCISVSNQHLGPCLGGG